MLQLNLLTISGQVNVLYEDDLNLLDFYPSAGMGVVYVTEADVVTGGYTYRSKLATLRKVHLYTYIFNNLILRGKY